MSRTVLGVDPGTRKVGFAVLDATGRVLSKGIEGVEGFAGCLVALAKAGPISAVALGRGTNSEALRDCLAAIGAPVHLVDERETTLRARGPVSYTHLDVYKRQVRVVLLGLNAALTDGKIGLSDPHARLRYGRPVGDGLRAIDEQLLVVEMNAVGRLVFDAVPQRLELGALQNGLPRFDDDALIGVFDIELAGHLLQDVPH